MSTIPFGKGDWPLEQCVSGDVSLDELLDVAVAPARRRGRRWLDAVLIAVAAGCAVIFAGTLVLQVMALSLGALAVFLRLGRKEA